MNQKPRFFIGFSYTLLVLSVIGALAALSESLGLRPLGDPMYESAVQAFVDFLLSIWSGVSVGMMIQRRKNGLALFNASFGANILVILKDSYESPWEIAFIVAITVAIYWFYNRTSVRKYLCA
jgi:hypothetical protein